MSIFPARVGFLLSRKPFIYNSLQNRFSEIPPKTPTAKLR